MKKLLGLIGAITLTTSVAAVTVVSCGMRTNQIEFKINNGDIKVEDVKGNPKQLMMILLELLTFNKRKYTSQEKADKVIKALGKTQSKDFNLYTLTSAEGVSQKYKDLNKKLNSINNEGIKGFEFVDVATTEFNKDNLQFSIVTQEYNEEGKNGIYSEPGIQSMDYNGVIGADIWGTKKDDSKNKNKEAFEKYFKDLKFKMIGEWASPTGGSSSNNIDLKEGETLANYERDFSTDGRWNFLVENKGENKKSYNFDILQSSTVETKTPVKATVKFGDLNSNMDKAVDINLEMTGLKTVMTPKGFSVSNVKPVKNEDGSIKTPGKKTFIYTWMPTVYTFADTFKNLKDKENIFHKINIKLT